MRYQRTQIYLEPEEHARLVRQAAERGISLAALMREIVAAHAREGAPAYQAKSMDAIIGIIDDYAAQPSEDMDEWDRDFGESVWREYVQETAWLRQEPSDPDSGAAS